METWFHHRDSHQKIHEDGEDHHGDAQEDGSVFSHTGLWDLSSGFLIASHLPFFSPVPSSFMQLALLVEGIPEKQLIHPEIIYPTLFLNKYGGGVLIFSKMNITPLTLWVCNLQTKRQSIIKSCLPQDLFYEIFILNRKYIHIRLQLQLMEKPP